MDAQLTPSGVPAITRLLDRAGTGPMVDRVKAHDHSPRPFLVTHFALCETKTVHLAGSTDHPSGHAANGWLEALILAQLAPDRSTALLARGPAYGESRVACRSHSVSAVQAGWMAGSVMFASLSAQPDFQHDLDAARREWLAARPLAARPDPQRCAAESALVTARPW